MKIDFAGRGRQATLPWIAILNTQETSSTQSGVYCVYLFREDLTGVYLTFAVGVTEPARRFGSDTAAYREYLKTSVADLKERAKQLAVVGFSLDQGIDLRSTRTLGGDYQLATVAYRFYESGAIPQDSLLLRDLEAALTVYDGYVAEKQSRVHPHSEPVPPKPTCQDRSEFDLDAAVERLVARIAQFRYNFEPWQIAAYVAAIKTKPFVILAGVTGTGKSTLPRLVSLATGGISEIVPVRPDWTDSADVLGYRDLQSIFRPGVLLELAKRAMREPCTEWTCILDEMNLARVEQYFAEVLSRIEDRHAYATGGYATNPLLSPNTGDLDWPQVVLPANLGLVGTVNMDESAHGFSRKVLDRAFTLELSEIDLTRWEAQTETASSGADPLWPVWAWYPRATALATLSDVSDDDRRDIGRVIDALNEVNNHLTQAQLQVGYRTRDEVALFVMHSREIGSSFRTSANENVDPLDLALHMKVLPRIIGGSAAVRQAILQLLGWSTNGVPRESEDGVQPILDQWHALGRPNAFPGAFYPRTASRLCLMWDRVVAEGFTSFWL